MFGHVKGAFTGADADRVGKFAEVGKGTLFLDEVDSLPLSLQAKLLRAVEERVFEPVGSNKSQPMQARLIVASSRPLEQEVAAGRFRVDLYYRLNVVAFTLPPLRERKEVIPHLVRGFLDEISARAGRPGLEHRARGAPRPRGAHLAGQHPRAPQRHRACRGPLPQPRDPPRGPPRTLPPPPARPRTGPPPRPRDPLPGPIQGRAERDCIAQALKRNGNNRLRAASELGISRMTLYNKLRKFGMMSAP